ncbi:MAG: hypothetical protein HYU69_03970 [Bacteroidetes bacterium]|nr:hypothetical protein [Bacteroidota bacterium]
MASNLQVGEKTYLKLFDAIAIQKSYNEAAIIKQFEKERFTKNFSVAKAYLCESILNSLEIFHSNKNIDSQLRKQISHIRILLSKKHYSLCLKLIYKAKKTASDFDFYTYAYELSTIEDTVMQQLNEIKWLEDNHEHFFQNEDRILEKLKNFQQYRKLIARSITVGSKQGKLRDPEIAKKHAALKKNIFLKDPSKALSNRAKISYYFLNGTYSFHVNDIRKSLNYFIQLKKFLESSVQLRKQYFHSYLYTMNNILTTGLGIMNFQEILRTLNSLKDITHNSHVERSNIQLRYYSHLSQIFIHYCKFNEAAHSLPEIEDWLKNNSRFKLDKSNELALLINISILYFTNEKHKICLNYLNKILNNETKDYAFDKYGFVRLFYLIVHVELKNHDLLPSLAASTHNYFLKHNRLYKFETLILDFIRKKLPEMNSKQSELKAYKELRSALEKIMKDPNEKSGLHNFDFIAWLDSKIEGRSFREVLKEKEI